MPPILNLRVKLAGATEDQVPDRMAFRRMEVIETGLLGCPPEKKAATLADSNEQCTFSGPV